MTIERTSVKIGIAVLYAALLVVTPMVYHWRPLIPTSGLRATFVEGQSRRLEARVYRMLFRPQLFIEIPGRDQSPNRWFAVDLERRTVSRARPDRSPYLHYNHDMMGVPVDDTVKGSGDWHVSWSSGQVRWSNGDITIQLDGT